MVVLPLYSSQLKCGSVSCRHYPIATSDPYITSCNSGNFRVRKFRVICFRVEIFSWARDA